MSGVQFEIKVITNNGAAQVAEVKTELNLTAEATTNLAGKMKGLGDAAFTFNNIRSAIDGVVSDFNKAIQPGIDFNSSLKDLQSITGVSNDMLDKIGATARQNAKDFGIDASTGVESYKLLLSQLGPELANTPEALNAMGRDAAILSKQLGGDTASATEILTTALNQYGVDIKDPIRATQAMSDMMNTMSAAAKEGSAELPAIKSALEQAGMMAKTANVPFNELNAAIQVLDKSGRKGAEGGVAIRNVLAEMSQGQFNSPKTLEMLKAAGVDIDVLANKSLSFADRLKELTPIVNDNAAMTQLFGRENVAAGIALVQNADEITNLTGKITGTNTATEMAGTVMESFSEKMARTNAWFKDLGISIFNATEGFVPFIQMGMGGLQVVANLGMAVQFFSTVSLSAMAKSIGAAAIGLTSWIGEMVIATAAQYGLNIAMDANPIGIIVLALAALVTGLVVAYEKSDKFRGVLNGLLEVGKLVADVFVGLGKVLVGVFTVNPAMIQEGVKQGTEAMSKILNDGISKAFNEGYNKVIDESNAAAAKAGAADAKAAILSKLQSDADAAFAQYHDGLTPQQWALNHPENPKGKGGKDKTINETASRITSGGARPTTINLVIHKLQDQTVIHTTNLEAGGKQAADKIIEMILMSLNSVNGSLQNS